jgi:hypothetical protein
MQLLGKTGPTRLALNMPSPFQRVVCGSLFVFALRLLGSSVAGAAEPQAVPLYALIVGGGPDQKSNAAQIEGHVRFMAEILPATAKHAVLFADGKAESASVAYADLSPVADAKRALAVLLSDDGMDEPLLTRAPKLGIPMDGPSRLQELRRAFTKLSAQVAAQPAPLLLYFAGHGTQNAQKEEDTQYDLWNGEELKVRDLAAEIARLPRSAPIVLMMAQCFSGAFADVLFRNADPKGALMEQSVVGFFSARKDREASGCSYATGAADYQDFSSYFLGALCGHDRFGNAISGADFDANGSATLHEAFCYALIHDDSSDTPVCTSDVFLKRFAPLSDAMIYSAPYDETWRSATAAQRAALDALSEKLGLSGEGRALAAYDRLKFSDPIARPPLVKSLGEAKERLNALRQTTLESLFKTWPALRWGRSRGYSKALEGTTDEIVKDQELCHALIDAEKARERAEEATENEEAALMRFSSLYESIVRARHLREHGPAEAKAPFERLWKAEQGSLPITRR